MQAVPLGAIRKVAELAGSGLPHAEFEVAAFQVVGDPGVARRIMDWLPEAFGTVLVSHMGSISFPKTFMARDIYGRWIEIPLANEPVFGEALNLARHMYRHGPGDVFVALATRSSVLDSVNQALNAGVSIDGAELSPRFMHGIPAETYGGGA